ncbi:MAG TPA: HlyD family efflux transporter periplasmic adaptor subunit [Gemmataceae bacterium]|nr:HlyD family efflux transporter periplasmic adaptor subunit [Gemmataceae bacterium]
MPAPSEKGGGAIHWGSLLLAATAGFALGGLGVYFYLYHYNAAASPNESETPQTSEKAEEVLPSALGRIEPKDGILYLGVPTPDRIAKILVKEGDHVASGKQLVELESENLRQLEEESAEIHCKEAKKRLEAIEASGKAQIQVEQLRLRQVEEFSPLELEAQRSKIKFLQSQVANAARDYQRLEKSGDTIAKQQKDKQRLLLEQAQEELTAAETQQRKLDLAQPLNRELAKARLVAAQAELERGQSTISLDLLNNQTAQARARRQAARITALSDGTILRLLAHKGDLVQGKHIVEMANLDKMIVVAEVPISFIPRIQVKDPATITSEVFRELGYKELEGEVYSIGKIAGKPQVASLDPLASVDYRIVEVKILLHQSEPAAKYIGHEVHVTIDPTKRGGGKP